VLSREWTVLLASELAEDLGAALEQITDILGDLTERSVSAMNTQRKLRLFNCQP
jgi:hypothetical protein